MEFPKNFYDVKMLTELFVDLQVLAKAHGTSIENLMFDCLIDFVFKCELSAKEKAEFVNRITQAKKSMNLEG